MLKGALTNFVAFAAVYDPISGRATGVQVIVTMQITLTERATGKLLFQRTGYEIRERYELSVNPQAYFDESGTAIQSMRTQPEASSPPSWRISRMTPVQLLARVAKQNAPAALLSFNGLVSEGDMALQDGTLFAIIEHPANRGRGKAAKTAPENEWAPRSTR